MMGAIGCGLLASTLVFFSISAAQKTKYQIVMAIKNIAKGQKISKDYMALSKPIAKINPNEYYLQIDDAVGMEAVQDIPKGKAIRRASVKVVVVIVPKGPDELPIPEGMQAFTLSKREIDRVPDIIKVGNYIDVLGYRRGYTESYSTIVHSAQVLSLADSGRGDLIALTVALTSQESEIVTSASKLGKLRVVVRAKRGKKPLFKSKTEEMEIIRGANSPKKVSFKVAPGPAIQKNPNAYSVDFDPADMEDRP